MNPRTTRALLAIFAGTALLSACKSTPDTDTPFPKVNPSASVFVGSQNQFVYAIDISTGAKKWEAFLNGPVTASPVLYNDIVFATTSNGPFLYKLDPIDGAKTQSKVTFPAGVTTTPIGQDNYICVSSGTKVTCIDITPDTVKWTFDAGAPINSSATIRDTQFIFGCDNGRVYNIDRRTGKKIWETANYGTLFPSSPTTDTQAIYIGGENGMMYAFNRKDGSLRWSYNAGSSKAIKSSPLIYGGYVIFGNDDNKLFCLENIYGTPRWTFTANDRIRSSPYLYGQTIFVGSYDKNFYAINVLDGTLRWTFATPGGLIASSPVCYQDHVFFGSYDKNLYALDTAKGVVHWRYAINGLIDCSPSIDPNDGKGMGINSTISGASIY